MHAGFRHRKHPEARLLTQEVCFGESETTSLKEKIARDLSYSFFGQTKC
jgi:hypothetical protein